MTDQAGQFSFVGLPPRQYSIDAILAGLSVDFPPDEIDLRANGCFVANVLMTVDRPVQDTVRKRGAKP